MYKQKNHRFVLNGVAIQIADTGEVFFDLVSAACSESTFPFINPDHHFAMRLLAKPDLYSGLSGPIEKSCLAF